MNIIPDKAVTYGVSTLFLDGFVFLIIFFLLCFNENKLIDAVIVVSVGIGIHFLFSYKKYQLLIKRKPT